MSDFIIGGIIAIMAVGAVIKLLKDRQSGKSSCGERCGDCLYRESCCKAEKKGEKADDGI